jgi:hypothetical protein
MRAGIVALAGVVLLVFGVGAFVLAGAGSGTCEDGGEEAKCQSPAWAEAAAALGWPLAVAGLAVLVAGLLAWSRSRGNRR